jgi:hypothetical protein
MNIRLFFQNGIVILFQKPAADHGGFGLHDGFPRVLRRSVSSRDASLRPIDPSPGCFRLSATIKYAGQSSLDQFETSNPAILTKADISRLE